MDENKLEKAMSQARASVEMEGYTITPEQESLVRAKLAGEITEEQFVSRLHELVYKK